MPDPRLTCAGATALLLLFASPAIGAEPVTSFAIATGQYGMRKEVPHSLGIELQLRTPWRWNLFRPMVGLLTSADGGAFVYTGLMFELGLPLGLQLSPGFAPGIALARTDSDLGSAVEFRSSLELSLAVGNRLRVGLAFSHISNARLGEHNPGVEVLVLGIAFPAHN
jgi:hypothetical protein